MVTDPAASFDLYKERTSSKNDGGARKCAEKTCSGSGIRRTRRGLVLSGTGKAKGPGQGGPGQEVIKLWAQGLG